MSSEKRRVGKPTPSAAEKRKRPRSSLARRNWEKFLSNRLAIMGGVVLLALILACVAAPLLTPYDPVTANAAQRLQSPSAAHPLGTDNLGIDLLARLLYGGRWSIFIGLASAVGASLLGVAAGCLSGYYGGLLDQALLYVSELFSVFPQTLLILICVGISGRSVVNMILIFIFTGWCGVHRIVRSRILSLKQEPFVESCRVNGVSGFSIMFRQLLPNTIGPVIVHTTLASAGYILAEAGLSFLGMGVPDGIPTWGNIINAAKTLTKVLTYPHLWLAPGIAISLFVLSINFFGDGLRDVFDPAQNG